MTKQEEILEHLIELFEQTPKNETPVNLARAVLWVLNEDDVAIKVDKPLPKPILGRNMSERDKEYKVAIWEYSQGAMLDAATEPLVKEG